MNKLLQFSTVHGGAGTAAGLLQWEDGIARGGAVQFTVPRDMAIKSVSLMGANSDFVTIIRGSHQSDNVVLPCLGDTLADEFKTIYLPDYLDGAGIILFAQEVVTITTTALGAGTCQVIIELDDAIPRVNVRGIRVAGSAAAVAATPTATGANIVAALSAASKYRFKAIFPTSTTIQKLFLRYGQGASVQYQVVEGQNAIAGGQGTFQKLKPTLEGLGSQFNTDLIAEILATAADAAAVQIFYCLFETN